VLTSAALQMALVDQLKVGVVVIDPDNRIVLFNRLAGEMLQEDPQERCGSTIFSCHPRESDAKVAQLIEDIKAGVLDHYEGWVNYRGRMLYEYILPIRGSHGEYLGMINELHDAADQAESLRRLGEWKDVHLSGVGARAPRPAEFGGGYGSDHGDRSTHRTQEGPDA
jgi:PAS domain S-box-containing protein